MLINKTPNGNDSCCRALSWKPYNCSCMKNRLVFLLGINFSNFEKVASTAVFVELYGKL